MARDEERGLIRALFRREPQDIRLTGYRVGDVTEGKAVRVVAGAAVAGELCAPEVVVEGLLFGSVVARSVVVGPRGRIWGDVYAVTLDVHSGGYVNGWLHTLTEDAYRSVSAQGDRADIRSIVDAQEPAEDEIPAVLRDAIAPYAVRPDQVALLRHFQAELRAAHLAREALERAFDERVEQVVGETQARAHQLEELLAHTRLELEAAQAAQFEQQTELVLWEERLETQGQELAGVRSLLHQRVEALRQAEQALASKRAQVTLLEASNTQLQEQVGSTLEPLERLQDRVESLESALQASVQHSAEQEEAQLRWQELAESSRARVLELENELKAVRNDLDTARQHNDDLQGQLAADEQGLAHDEQPSPAVASFAGLHDDLQARSARLESQLAAAQAEIAALEEQVAWQRLSLDAAVASLAARGVSEATFQDRLQDAAAQARDYQELADNWKANVGRLTELLYEAGQESKRQAAEIERLRGQVQAARVERGKLQQAATRHITELQAELEARDRQLEEQASRAEKRRRP